MTVSVLIAGDNRKIFDQIRKTLIKIVILSDDLEQGWPTSERLRATVITLIPHRATSKLMRTDEYHLHPFLPHKTILLNSSEVSIYKKDTLQYEWKSRMKLNKEPWVGHPLIYSYISTVRPEKII